MSVGLPQHRGSPRFASGLPQCRAERILTAQAQKGESSPRGPIVYKKKKLARLKHKKRVARLKAKAKERKSKGSTKL